ncbi:MAG: hypothetical protein RL189_338 [Pseudomonadota bacterium]|jgi:hypothetical protein
MRVDLLTLYALSDKAHAKQRELWRGFLALVMPILLEYEASEFERVLESAQCRSVETMLAAIEEPTDVGQLVWSVSGTFAELLGFEAEMGLAAFLDVNLPTRIHAVGGGLSAAKDEAIISHWLKAFREIQQRPEFLEITSEWKRAFDAMLDIDREDEESDVDESEDNDEISDDTAESSKSA